MKRIRYFIRSYIFDIIAAISGVILVIITLSPDSKMRMVVSLIIVTLTLLVIIYTRLRAKKFVFSALTWRRDGDSWMGYGKFEYSRTEDAFNITQAHPGFIHNECLTWTNYSLDFDFKIENRCLGVVVRAVNLSNYVMLQITGQGIRPHILINGAWKIWEAKQSNLDGNIPFNIWCNTKITLDKNDITIIIYDKKKEIFNHHWNIPAGIVVFNYRKSESESGIDIPFRINLEYGSAGFRNDGAESAYIRNFLIEKI